jgi:hypothetical protein
VKFSGELKFPEIDHPGVPITVLIEGSQTELVIEGETLGRWSLYDVHARRLVANAFLINLDGSEVTFVADDPIDFAYRGVEHMAETWAGIKSKRMAARSMAVRKSRQGTIPSRIDDIKEAMRANLEEQTVPRQLAGEVAMPSTGELEGLSEPAPDEEVATTEGHAGPPVSPAVSEELERLEEEKRHLAEEWARFEEERRLAEQREADRIEAFRLEMQRLEAEREEVRRQATELAERAESGGSSEADEPVVPPQGFRPPWLVPEAASESSPVAAEPEPLVAAGEPEPEVAAVEPEPEVVAVEPEPEVVAVEPEPEEAAGEPEPEVVTIEPDPNSDAAEPDPTPPRLVETIKPAAVLDLSQAEDSPATASTPEREPAMAGTARDKTGLMGAVRAAFRSGPRDHEHKFIEAPGGIGITRYVCEECGYVSISA